VPAVDVSPGRTALAGTTANAATANVPGRRPSLPAPVGTAAHAHLANGHPVAPAGTTASAELPVDVDAAARAAKLSARSAWMRGQNFLQTSFHCSSVLRNDIYKLPYAIMLYI